MYIWIFTISILIFILVDTIIANPEFQHHLKKNTMDLFYNSEDEWLAENLLQESIFIPLMRNRLGSKLDQNISVFIAYSKETFNMLSSGEMPEWVAAIAQSSSRRIVLKSPRMSEFGELQIRRTLYHEITHIVLKEALSGHIRRMPRWFDEGAAQYYAGQWDLTNYLDFWTYSLMDNFIPLHELEDGFPMEADAARKAYDESYRAFSYFIEQYGEESVKKLVTLMRQGTGFESAFAQSTMGITPMQFEKLWLKEIRVFYYYIPIITSATTFWILASLLFVYSYIKKKQKTRRRLEEMEFEEEIERRNITWH